jgi:hypothetical protein
MKKNAIIITGTVVEGHRVASGPSQAYPYSSLERQLPHFKAAGLDLYPFFRGTLNICIAPATFKLIKPAHTFRQVDWTDLHPPEDFSFSPCRVAVPGQRRWYTGYVYYPHPETKIRHYHNPSLIEVIAEKIAGIRYGSRLKLELDPSAIEIIDPAPSENLE